MFKFCSILFGAAAIAALAGCQQVAWKPGASAADLNRDSAACRAQSAADAAVKDCLRQRGWVLRSAAAAQAEDDVEAADDGSPAVPAPSSLDTPISTTNVPARDKLVPASAAPAQQSPPTAAAAPTAPSAAKPAKKAKTIDPLTPQRVQSWWKVGAGAADLAADQAACVDTLGVAHRPDQRKRLYTQGMIDCLRARGWSGY